MSRDVKQDSQSGTAFDVMSMKPPVGAPAFARLSFWPAHMAVWIFLALFGLASRIAAFNDIALAITLTLTLDPAGFALTGLAQRFYLARTRDRPAVVAGWVFAGSVLGGAFQMVLAGWIKTGLFPGISGGETAAVRVIPMIYYTAAFLGWSLAYFWLRADIAIRSERARRSEAQAVAAKAELKRLRLQLNPHFLFNALNTVAAEIPDNPDLALEMTHRMAAYLRYSLDQQTRLMCPLSEEIEAVRDYVRMQELRFAGRLRCVVEMDPAARPASVPHLIVQGLVENAIKHGLRTAVSAPQVHVKVRRSDDDAIEIEVSNPGRLAPRTAGIPPIGLKNTRQRLELHYPSRHNFSLTQSGDKVLARLKIWGAPCHV